MINNCTASVPSHLVTEPERGVSVDLCSVDILEGDGFAGGDHGRSEGIFDYRVVNHFVAFGSEMTTVSALETVFGLTKLFLCRRCFFEVL